ncbi:hypothetical protein SCHPADRAFT_851115 [Schizopora paradoxa]|uniref:Uncharacterized protein n=1 Tax=Schizopora paradoxa TaxID=27342 RepID=A0A0H2RRB4_9AGAM|nr:hypothetical protein SCHPADRAFT_851115 [Schizopora paradoxa]
MVNKQLARNLNGVETEVLLQYFADRVLVIVTQLGKVGCFIQATIPSTTPLPIVQKRKSKSEQLVLPKPPPAVELSKVFGTAPSDEDDLLYSLYASQIATTVWTSNAEDAIGGERRNVMVGLSLRKKMPNGDPEREREMYMQVIEMVMELLETQ